MAVPGVAPGVAAPRAARVIRRLFRQAVVTLIAVVTAVTAVSIGYNLATDGGPWRPAGLRMIRAGGFDTRYLAWGKRESQGPPIVLVPGAFETADTFAALGPVLGVRHRVFAIDLTGTGYSTTSPPFDASHLAAQVLAFVRGMNLTGANAPVLVGHSSGAAVVGMAALLDRGAVAGIVFLDGDATPLPVPPVIGWLLINPYRTTLVRLALSSSWLIRQIYQSQCGPGCRPLSAAGVQAWRRPLEQPGFLDVVAYNARHGIPSMSDAQLRALRVIAVPKAVIFGRNDPQLGYSDARATAISIDALPPVAIPGRHLTMISSPHRLAAAISAFIGALQRGLLPAGPPALRAGTRGKPGRPGAHRAAGRLRFSSAFLLERLGRLAEAASEWRFIARWMEESGDTIHVGWPRAELRRLEAQAGT